MKPAKKPAKAVAPGAVAKKAPKPNSGSYGKPGKKGKAY